MITTLYDHCTTLSHYGCIILYVRYSRVRGKSVSCLKNKMRISKKSSYDFGWELGKRLAMPHVQSRSLNGLKSSMQWKIKMFLGTAFEVEQPLSKVEQRHKCTGK